MCLLLRSHPGCNLEEPAEQLHGACLQPASALQVACPGKARAALGFSTISSAVELRDLQGTGLAAALLRAVQAPQPPVESTLPNSRRTTVSESGLLVVAGQQHSDAPQQEELTRVRTGTLADYWGVQAQSGRHASGQLLGGEPQVQGHGLQGPGPWRVAPLFTALLVCEQLPAAGQMLAPVDRVQKLPERATQGALPSRASVEASGPSSTSAAAPATTPPQSAPNQSAQPPDIEQGLSTPQLAPPPNRSWFRLPLRQTQQ